ncbi:MAG: fructose-bisphosphatase class III [Clostridia bacterium]|nr:fructose-bisphosphatase class III [Clostridia bacterium]
MVYVTSDLHGIGVEKLKALLDSVEFSEKDFLFILGDVIDRGDHGIELIKYLMDKPNMELLLGNHEAMMLGCRFLFEEINDESIDKLTGDKLSLFRVWLQNGAEPTIDALKKESRETVTDIYDYLLDCPLYDTASAGGKDFVLTHCGLGGFEKGKRLKDYESDELLWHRPDINDKYFDNIITIFGHTPTRHYGNEHNGKILKTATWIDIDVGVVYGNEPVLLRLDDLKEIYLKG